MDEIKPTIEQNPFRPSVPDSVREVSSHLYDYLSEQAPLLRETYWMTLKASKALDSKIEDSVTEVKAELTDKIESINFDTGPIQGQIDNIKLSVKKFGDETKIRFDSVDAKFKANTADAERMIRMVSEKVAVTNPDKIMGMFNERLDLTAQYSNLANTAAGNAIDAAQDTWVNLKATEEFKRLAEVKADEAGFHASSSAILRSEAAISSNLSKASAAAAAVSEQNAEVHMTQAGVHAQAALTHKTAAETAAGDSAQSAGIASTKAEQASQSATNAAGSESRAGAHAETSTNAATAAGNHAGNAQTFANQSSQSASDAEGSKVVAQTQAGIAVSARTDVIDLTKFNLPQGFDKAESFYVGPIVFHTDPNVGDVWFAGYENDAGGVRTAAVWRAYAEFVPQFSVPAVPGRTLRATLKWRSPESLNASAVIHRQSKLTQNGPMHQYYGSSQTVQSVGDGWQYLMHEWTIPAGLPDPFVSFYFGLDGQGGKVARAASLTIEDITESKASANAAIISEQHASASSGHANTALTQASNATVQAGNALNSATQAQSHANAADEHRASSLTYSQQAASRAARAYNTDTNFARGMSGNQVLGWNVWGNFHERYMASSVSHGIAIQDHSPANDPFCGFAQPIEGVTSGPAMLECTVQLIDGGWFGSFLYINGLDSAGNFIQSDWIDFFHDADVRGHKIVDGPNTGHNYWGIRRFKKLIRLVPGVAKVELYCMTAYTIAGANTQYKILRWHEALIRPGTLQEAAVTRQSGVIVDVAGRTRAFLEETVAANGTEAAVRLRAGDENGVQTSDIDLIAGKITLRSNADGIQRKALEVIGTTANFYGDVNVGGAIRIGARRIPIALQSFAIQASDGEVVNFGADLINIPNLTFGTEGLAPREAGQSYDVRALNLTSTGFTMYTKIITPATPTAVAAIAGVNTGGAPAWRANKGAAIDSANGYYNFQVTMSIACYSPLVGDPYEGQGGFDAYVRVAGQANWQKVQGVWEVVVPGNRQQGEPATKAFTVTLNANVYFGGVIGQDGDYEFGVVATGGTITAFPGVSYSGQGTSGGVSSATPNGQKVAVTVIPKNQ